MVDPATQGQLEELLAEHELRHPEILDWDAFRRRLRALSPEQQVRLLLGAGLLSRQVLGRSADDRIAAQEFLNEVGDQVAAGLGRDAESDPLELMLAILHRCHMRFAEANGRDPRTPQELARWWLLRTAS